MFIYNNKKSCISSTKSVGIPVNRNFPATQHLVNFRFQSKSSMFDSSWLWMRWESCECHSQQDFQRNRHISNGWHIRLSHANYQNVKMKISYHFRFPSIYNYGYHWRRRIKCSSARDFREPIDCREWLKYSNRVHHLMKHDVFICENKFASVTRRTSGNEHQSNVPVAIVWSVSDYIAD